MNSIYIIQHGQNKYYVAKDIISDISGKKIENMGYLIRGFSINKKIGRKNFIISQEELDKINNKDSDINVLYSPSLYEFYDIIQIFIVSKIPKGAYLRTDNVPRLKNSKGELNVFNAVEKQIGNETIDDNTVYANRAIFKRQEGSLTLEERDQKLLEHDLQLDTELVDPVSYLKELQYSSNNLIATKEKKLLKNFKIN